MKALIISDDTSTICRLDDFLTKQGFGTIIYRWLLKALDNIEEIRPDCVIVSSSEYPRHWKTLVQFLKSGIGGNKIGIYLYEPKALDEDDQKKAVALGVTGYITSLEESELEKTAISIQNFFGKNKIENQIITTENEIKNKENIEPLSGTGHILFTNPVSHKFVKGTYFDKNEKQITVKLDFDEDIKDMSIKTLVPEFTYFYGNESTSVECRLKEILDINGEQLVIFSIEN